MFSVESAEWLETDGLGGFASGTVAGVRTRRYHALLLAATTPPTGRYVLVNGLEAWARTPAGDFAITSQRYAHDYLHPDGYQRIEAFSTAPWPRWTIRLDDGTRIQQEVCVSKGLPLTLISWRLLAAKSGVELFVRPLISGREHHNLHHRNDAFNFDVDIAPERVAWKPYPGVPAIIAVSNAEYRHEPDWYRNFYYAQEASRGMDATEDLASPGIFRFDLSAREAILTLSAECSVRSAEPGVEGGGGGTGGAGHRPPDPEPRGRNSALSPQHSALLSRPADALADEIRRHETDRRRAFRGQLERAADAYIVRRGPGCSVIAGYPWFTDWGRDTFISLRGLCLATGRLAEAGRILAQWAGAVSEGMLPNRFPDGGGRAEYNSVDASLWFIIAAHEFLCGLGGRGGTAGGSGPRASSLPAGAPDLTTAIEAILDGYSRGTRYNIRADEDGLLAAGAPGTQLTWMDAKVGDWVVTPRVGKPVEVQALWLNALRIGHDHMPGRRDWAAMHERGLRSFQQRFWDEEGGRLHDVVDADHRPGAVDPLFRPNQVFAVGGLPDVLLPMKQARRLVKGVEERLLTPVGLRTLAPGEPGYIRRYDGGPAQRDAAYHQGAVWPWLMGPFVEAWVRVRGQTAEAKMEARKRFLEPLLRNLNEGGLGHISEIADADPPHTPRGCPFQAWSVAEAMRLDRVVLGALEEGCGAASA